VNVEASERQSVQSVKSAQRGPTLLRSHSPTFRRSDAPTLHASLLQNDLFLLRLSFQPLSRRCNRLHIDSQLGGDMPALAQSAVQTIQHTFGSFVPAQL